jgi:site-specific recombinase XerD
MNALSGLQLPAVDVAQLDRYLARKRAEGLAPRTLNRHLNLVHSLLKAAEARGLVRSNPTRRKMRSGLGASRRAWCS